VTVRVTCPKGEKSCRITLTLKTGKRILATKTFTVAGGKTLTVNLKLNAAARRGLSVRRPVKAAALVTARDQAGNTATTTTPIQLLAANR
jgi:hypothetical protein